MEYPPPGAKWRALILISLAEFLAMAVWFSASPVVPLLAEAWRLSESQQAWLTMSVQLGFVFGTLTSALLNLADRLPPRALFAASALLAAVCTALIPAVSRGPLEALALRFATGFLLAGVYPMGMKLMTTWTREDRGTGLGLLVGALTLGSAAPHLLRAALPTRDWQSVLYGSAALAACGAAIAAGCVRAGPYRTAVPRFHWRYAGQLLRERGPMLANLGYLGHMWELYAMWSWVPMFLFASFGGAGAGARTASYAAFAAIAAGAPGSLIAGWLADRIGRPQVTSAAMLASGSCAIATGFLFGGSPALLTFLCVIWGFAVVADSAQFSACVTELCRKEYAGTALTLQTCLGFLLTLATIRLVPLVQARAGWRWAFLPLAIGPACGIAAMMALRRRPGTGGSAGATTTGSGCPCGTP